MGWRGRALRPSPSHPKPIIPKPLRLPGVGTRGNVQIRGQGLSRGGRQGSGLNLEVPPPTAKCLDFSHPGSRRCRMGNERHLWATVGDVREALGKWVALWVLPFRALRPPQ